MSGHEVRTTRARRVDLTAMGLAMAAFAAAMGVACSEPGSLVDAHVPDDQSVVVFDAVVPELDTGPPCPSRVFEGDYAIADEASLLALTGYTEVTGDLVVDGVASLAGAECLTTIGGDLLIVNTAAITDLDALTRLQSVGGDVALGYTGFHTSTKMGPSANTTLSSVAGLRGLRSIPGSLTIDSCTSLQDLHGLDRVASVGGDLLIAGGGLEDLDGLDELSSIGGDLMVFHSSLTNVDALRGVTTIGGSVGVYGNASLSSLTGLANVEAIRGTEPVSFCSVVVCGGHGIGALPAGIGLASNDRLRTFGFDDLVSLSGGILVRWSPELPTCAVTGLVDRLSGSGWSGEPIVMGTDDIATCL